MSDRKCRCGESNEGPFIAVKCKVDGAKPNHCCSLLGPDMMVLSFSVCRSLTPMHPSQLKNGKTALH